MTVSPDGHSLATALDGITSALRDSTAASRETAAAVRATERRRRRSTIVSAVVGVLLLVATIAILVTLRQVQGTQDAIKDCTDLTRRSAECARSAREGSARTVNAITQGQLATSYVTNLCAFKTPVESDYRRCVENGLKRVASGDLALPAVPTPAPSPTPPR